MYGDPFLEMGRNIKDYVFIVYNHMRPGIEK